VTWRRLGWVLIAAVVIVAVYRTSEDRFAPPLAKKPSRCNDRVDNVADRRIDYPADPGCVSKADTSEADPATIQPVGQSGWKRVVFADEFNGTSVDSRKWITGVQWWMGIGCQDEANNVSVSGGVVHLVARSGQSSWCTMSDYSTAVLQTAHWGDPHPFAFTYGYVEARVKIPPGKGLWPAVWLSNTGDDGGGEIDLAEWSGHATDIAWLTVHWPNRAQGFQQTSITGADWGAGYHVIGVRWQRARVTWYVDGVRRFRVTDSRVPARAEYVVLDLSVTDAWPGAPDATTRFPADFQVDYLRVWKR
jgi:beta-glucanase (GH16 family)